jgi:peptide/nickel transport system substrate-binding protein
MCLALVSGCGGLPEEIITATPTPEPTPTPAPTTPAEPDGPVEGGTLRIPMREPVTLNPLLNEDVTVDRVLKLLFEPLTVLDSEMKPTGNIADINFATDYASAIVTIKPEAIWSDGMPVSAEDFIYSVEVLRSAPGNAIYKHSIDNIAECESLDGKNIRITFVEPFGGTAYLFDFPLIPEHHYSGGNDMLPLGNGLYTFEEYEPGKSMRLLQSPYTFRQRAYIEYIDAVILPDAETELHAFDQRLIDVISLEVTEWSRHKSTKPTHYGEYTAMYYEFIGFNFKTEIISDFRFREAVARCFNADELISDVFLTHAARSVSPINPASWLYDADAPVYGYDTERAKTLIEQIKSGEVAETTPTAEEAPTEETVPAAEETPTEETTPASEEAPTEEATPAVRVPVEIPALRVITNEENEERVKIANALVEGMESVGLSASLETLPFDGFVERLNAGEFDLFVGSYNLSLVPDLRFAFSGMGIYEGSNLLSYANRDMDALLDAAFAASTEAAYRRSLSSVQRYIAENLPVISLAFRKSAVITDTRVYGEIRPSAGNPYANINEWFIFE